MVYIIILNWMNAPDTINCVKSALNLDNAEYKIVICDNASPDSSYENIKIGVNALLLEKQKKPEYQGPKEICELNVAQSNDFKSKDKTQIYFIQTGQNLGYAGGNNVGMKFAAKQDDFKYAWLLNNDTEVEPDSLYELLERCKKDPVIGICGSKLVNYESRGLIQGLGGVYRPVFCRVKIYAANEESSRIFDDDITEKKIDYVIGASMLIDERVIHSIGMLDEGYFLYYEELDLAVRASKFFKISSAQKSIVYHKEGGTIGKTELADYFSLRNRIKFTLKHNKRYLPTVWLGLIGSLLNRVKQGEFRKAKHILMIMFFLKPKAFKKIPH